MKILFVCTGNSCRSAMAKAYLEKRLKELDKQNIEVSSAGVAPLIGMQATKEARQIATENGADLFGHFARKVTELAMKETDLIFVMEKRHKRHLINMYPPAAKKTYLLKDFKELGDFTITEDPNIPDPIGRDINFYRATFAIIKDSIERILQTIG